MRLTKNILVLFIALVAGIINSFTQIKLLIDYAAIPPFGVAQQYYDTLLIDVHTKALTLNNADTSATGNVFYWYQTDMMKSDGLPPRLVDDNPAFETIPQGGFFDRVDIIVRPEEMRTGPINVIIIWPAMLSPNVDVVDSGFTLMNNQVLGYLGNEEIFTPSNIYPNPAVEFVYISSAYTDLIEQVQIINSLGQPVYQTTTNGMASGGILHLPTASLTTGIYYINILYKDRKQETVKFLKQ